MTAPSECDLIHGLLRFAESSLATEDERWRAVPLVDAVFSLSVDDYRFTRKEMTAPALRPWPDADWKHSDWRAAASAANREVVAGLGGIALSTESDVLPIQREWRRILDALLTGQSFEIKAAATYRVRSLEDAGIDRFAIYAVGDPVQRFTAAILPLLRRHAARLRRCALPTCGKPFFATKSHQRQCSDACREKRAQQRYAERHADQLADIAHEKYKRRRVRELGKGVQVERRPSARA